MDTDSMERARKQYKTPENLNLRQELHNYNINKYNWHVWCYDNMKIPDRARILELGCGNGLLWEKNADRINEGWDITLSDLSQGMLGDVRKRLSNVKGRFNYEIIDAQSIPYPKECFDVVIARHMLYHVPDLNKALNEIRRVLKPCGIFYASTNGETAMMELKRLVDEFDSNINFSPNKLTGKFGLKNGEKLINEFFKQTSLKLYEGRIVVNIPEPVVGYIKSINSQSKYFLESNREEEFYEYIKNQIRKNGSISITTLAGLFEAVKE